MFWIELACSLGYNQFVNYCIQAEGIFRINAENSQEEFVRDQLNRGVIPEGIDVHCLAGLIKVISFCFRICKGVMLFDSNKLIAKLL